MNPHFTYAHLETVLDRALATHVFQTYQEALSTPRPRSIILRHDLDFSAGPALPLAVIEAKRGIVATYFLMVHGPYDPLTEPERGRVSRLLALGHRLGLHVDVTDYATDSDIGASIARDARRLATSFDTEVAAMSRHRPGPLPLPSIKGLDGVLDAYDPAFTRDRKYLSDSRQSWREGCICRAIGQPEWPRLQLLLHPIWWSADGRPAADCLATLRSAPR